MNEGLAARIRKCAEIAGSGDELSRLAAIPRRTLEYYLTGEREPKVSRCVEIAKAVGVDVGWLVSGEGPMRTDLRTADVQEGGYIAKADEFVYVTRMRMVTGESGDMQVIDSRYAFRADWIRENGWDTDQLMIDHARDGAMRPEIRPGDLLLLEAFHHLDGSKYEPGLPPGSLPPEDGVYKISLNGATAVRRLQADMMGGVFVSADASDGMGGRVVPSESPGFRILSRVVWAGHVIE